MDVVIVMGVEVNDLLITLLDPVVPVLDVNSIWSELAMTVLIVALLVFGVESSLG